MAEAKFSLQKALTQMNKKFQLPLDRPNIKVRKQSYHNKQAYLEKINLFRIHTTGSFWPQTWVVWKYL